MVSQFLEEVLMGFIEQICNLESQLLFHNIFYIEISSYSPVYVTFNVKSSKKSETYPYRWNLFVQKLSERDCNIEI